MSFSGIGSASGKSGSFAGSTSSSRSSATRLPGADNEFQEGAGDDIFDRRSSLETGVFGVLCTLRKENNEARIRIRWVLLKIVLDAWQLFTTIIAPARQGWSIDTNGPAWTVISVLNFGWLSDLSYGWYLALLYVMVGLLGVHVGLCIWVAWCFNEQKFPVVWPLKALRIFSGVFFQAFDVAALNLLQLGITCNYTGIEGPERPRLHLELFSQYSCNAMPHVLHAVVSGLSLSLFVAIALLTNMAEVEVNLLSRRPFALGHSGPIVLAFALKVLLTLVHVFIGWRRVEACIYMGLSLAFAWQFVRWNPHLVAWVNYVRSGVAGMVVWCCAMLMLLVFHPTVKREQMDRWADTMTVLMLTGLAPAFAAGALMSWGMIRYITRTTLRDLREAKQGVHLPDVCRAIDDPRDVEVVVRCCRVWKDKNKYTVDPEAVHKARQVIQAGIAMFPNSAYMVLLQANFMIDVLGVRQSGSRRIEDARKLNPGLMSRFIMFVRQQQASQQAAGTRANNGGASMDLLAYVEYQRKQRMVIRLHREALQAMCSFWKALDGTRVSFTHLSKALSKIESSVTKAQTAYRVVLETHGHNPKLVRLYGKFMLTIKNDPWRASEYFSEADRLEEVHTGDTGGPMLPDGTPLGRMDELATAVLVVSANGEVQMANRHTHVLFGYKRGALEGKPMATLLAPHFSRWLADHLSYLVDESELLAAVGPGRSLPEGASNGGGADGSAHGGALTSDAVVVGMHADRLAFPVRLALRKASGVGEDSTFIVMMEVVPPVTGVASIWVAHNGTIVACDPQFVMSFGWKPQEVNGAALPALMAFQGAAPQPAPALPTCTSGTAATVAPPDGGAGCAAAGAQFSGNAVVAAVAASSVRSVAAASASEAINRLLQYARASYGGCGAGAEDGLRCVLAHKYDREPVPCTASIVNAGILDATVYEVKIRLSEASLRRQMLVVNRKGALLHASTDMLALMATGGGGGADGSDGDGGEQLFGGGSPPLLMSGAAAGGGVAAAGVAAAASAAAALGPASRLAVGVEHLAGLTLCDLLPSPWKEMHYKYLRGGTGVSPLGRNPWSCRKEGHEAGPTLELRSLSGKPLFMSVSVATTDVAGELNHVVRLTRSSLEAALGERRLRIQTTQEGLISSVSGGPAAQMFGLGKCKLAGRCLWEIFERSSDADSNPGGELPAPGPLMFMALVKRELAEPGRSYRVRVSAPAARVPGAGQTSELVAAARASRTRQAVLQVHVKLPVAADSGAATDRGAESSGFGDDEPTILVDLWLLSSVTGVVEVDSSGRIRTVLEERLRPVGLLFGVASQSLVNCQLAELLALPPGRVRPADLLYINGAKKSSLKTTTLESSVKVGPVHVLQASHTDGQRNTLDIQVVGKPGGGQSLYVIMRCHNAPMIPAAATGCTAAAGGRGGTAAATSIATARQPKPVPGVLLRLGSGSAARGDGGVASADTASPFKQPPGAPQAGPTGLSRPSAAAAAGIVAAAASMSVDGRMSSEGVTSVPTPRPEPLQRRATGGTTTSGSHQLEDGPLVLTTAAGPTPPPPEGLEGRLADGLPVPVVVAPSSKSVAGMLSARSRLADMVRSVEGSRTGSGSGIDKGNGSQRSPDNIILRAARQLKTGAAGAAGGDEITSPAGVKDGSMQFRRPDVVLVTADSPPGSSGGIFGGAGALGAATLPMDVESLDGSMDIERKPGAPAVLAGKERISTWVASQGAYYQNSVNPDEAAKGSGGGFRAPRYDEAPGLSLDLKVLLRKRSDGAAAGSDDEEEDVSARPPRGGGGASPAAGGDYWAQRQQLQPFGGEWPPPPPPPDDLIEDDAASEGGQSAMSAQTGNGGADYKRGRRFRKLMKLMDSGQAHQVQRRYRLHALATVALLAAVHIVCFALTIHSIVTKRDSMLQLGRSGQSQRYMHQIMTDVRALDVISRNRTQPNLYNASDTAFFIRRISTAADEVQTRFKNILDSHADYGSTVRGLLFFTTRRVWSGNEENGTDKYTNITIWDFTTRFCAMAHEVEQHAEEWITNRVAIVDNTTAGQFLIKSGPDMWRASRQVLDALLYVAVSDARWVDNMHIVFLCVEGAAVTSVAACYLAYLLRAVSAQRYKLYGIFMLIPLGLTRALASQNTNLAVEDEDEDNADDIDDKAPSLGAAEDQGDEGAAAAAAKQKRRASIAVFSSRDAAEDGGGGAGIGSEAGVTSPKALGMYDVGGGRKNRSFRTRSGAHQPQQQWRRHIDSAGSGDRTVSSGGVSGGLLRRLRNLFTSRGARISPLPKLTSADGASSKRKLKYDSHETATLLMPFVFWSVLVVAIYTIAVIRMQGIVQVLAVHSVVNFITARTYRAAFFSQELGAVEDPALLATRRSAVADVAKVVRDAWYTLQLGADAYKAAGPNTERFPMVKGGVAYSSNKLADLFYRNGLCHRVQANLPCPGSEYRFYNVIHSGLDTIMHLFLMNLEKMASSKSSMPPGLGDDSLDFIYNVGTKDLIDGTVRIQEAHLETIIELFYELFELHIILIVVFFVIFSGFVGLLLNPLLQRISRERRRAAELMSQLPLELDVERLVARALGTATSGSTPAAGGVTGGLGGIGPRTASGGEGATPGSPGSDSEAADNVTKWKNIIRSASSQLVKAQSGSIRSKR